MIDFCVVLQSNYNFVEKKLIVSGFNNGAKELINCSVLSLFIKAKTSKRQNNLTKILKKMENISVSLDKCINIPLREVL